MVVFEDLTKETCLKLGLTLRINRILKEMSLRELANETTLSHTLLNKIEHGLTKLTASNIEKLNRVFNTVFEFDQEKDRLFIELIDKTYEKIIYPDPPKITTTFQELEKHQEYYLKSIYSLDYLIAYIGVYNRPYHKRMDQVSKFLTIASTLTRQMSQEQRLNYYMFKGIYHHYTHDYETSIRNLHTAIELNPIDHIKALITYYIARSYSDSYQLFQARKYFQETEQLCQKSHNLKRLIYALFFQTVNEIKRGNYQPFNEYMKMMLHTYKNEYTGRIISYIAFYELVCAILQNHNKEVFDKYQRIEYKDDAYCFYVAYFAYKQNDESILQDALENLEKCETVASMYFQGIKAFQSLMVDKKTAEQHLKTFFEAALEVSAYIETTIAFELYREHLIENRKYKKACDITDIMTRIHRKTLE